MPVDIHANVSLRSFSTLRAGGNAERFAIVRHVDDLAQLAIQSQSQGAQTTYLGWGSNVLPSDDGVPGLVVVNDARNILIERDGSILADSGCGFQELFLSTAQAGFTGLQYAVGIPGSLGGALVSNAGAYRSCISDSIVAIEIVESGKRQWVEPNKMRFSYRDSILRSSEPPPICLLRVKLQLERGKKTEIYNEARDYQRQRISKQPPSASAGSFFKNVNDSVLAESLVGLRPDLRAAGVVPSGFLIEACGLKGQKFEGAMIGDRHANFILNVGGATAFAIRNLATHAQQAVFEKFGIQIEEEALYLGDWSQFQPKFIRT